MSFWKEGLSKQAEDLSCWKQLLDLLLGNFEGEWDSAREGGGRMPSQATPPCFPYLSPPAPVPGVCPICSIPSHHRMHHPQSSERKLFSLPDVQQRSFICLDFLKITTGSQDGLVSRGKQGIHPISIWGKNGQSQQQGPGTQCLGVPLLISTQSSDFTNSSLLHLSCLFQLPPLSPRAHGTCCPNITSSHSLQNMARQV